MIFKDQTEEYTNVDQYLKISLGVDHLAIVETKAFGVVANVERVCLEFDKNARSVSVPSKLLQLRIHSKQTVANRTIDAKDVTTEVCEDHQIANASQEQTNYDKSKVHGNILHKAKEDKVGGDNLQEDEDDAEVSTPIVTLILLHLPGEVEVTSHHTIVIVQVDHLHQQVRSVALIGMFA